MNLSCMCAVDGSIDCTIGYFDLIIVWNIVTIIILTKVCRICSCNIFSFNLSWLELFFPAYDFAVLIRPVFESIALFSCRSTANCNTCFFA